MKGSIRCSNKECRSLFLPKVLFAQNLSIPHRDKKAIYYCCHCFATSATGRNWKRKCSECGVSVESGGLYAADGEVFNCLCLQCKQKINPQQPQQPQQPKSEKDIYPWLYCHRCGELKTSCRSC